MEPQLDPNEIPNPEQEALLKVSMDSQESLEDINANTGASAVKLGEIEQNQEAQLVQSMKSTKEMIETIAPSLQAQERMANIFSSLMTNLEGPPGKTPVKGEDYFTDQEIADFLNKATPKKGEDYFTAEEIKQFRESVTPKKDVDYRDGVDGVDGVDARNPMTVSANAPTDPQPGDIWYQP